jgi:hypothetical protein
MGLEMSEKRCFLREICVKKRLYTEGFYFKRIRICRICEKKKAQSLRDKNPFALPTPRLAHFFVLSFAEQEQDIFLFSDSYPTLSMSCGRQTTRKPALLLRLSGVLLLRKAERLFCPLLFHEPPRKTRCHSLEKCPYSFD